MVETINSVIRVPRQLQELGHDLPEEIAEEMSMPVTRCGDSKIAQEPVSLETPSARGGLTRATSSPTRTPPSRRSVAFTLLKEQLVDVGYPDPRGGEGSLRFGCIEDGRTRTLEECGQGVQRHRERIRQIEAKA